MAEWTKAAVLKTAVGSRPPGVRIPLPPPYGYEFRIAEFSITRYPKSKIEWGGARVADRGRLLSGCRGFTSTVGSNPTLPASSGIRN